jgi:hypothetical protein
LSNTLLGYLERQAVCLFVLKSDTYPGRRALKTLIKFTGTRFAGTDASRTFRIPPADRRLNERIAGWMNAVADCYRHRVTAVIHIISTFCDIAFDDFRHFHDLPLFPASNQPLTFPFSSANKTPRTSPAISGQYPFYK